MPFQEIVDLSLSTDDEKTLKPSKSSAGIADRRHVLDYLDSDCILDTPKPTQRPTKRMKVTPPAEHFTSRSSHRLLVTEQAYVVDQDGPKVTAGEKSQTSAAYKAPVEHDPIVFSSSPHPLAGRRSWFRNESGSISPCSELPSDPLLAKSSPEPPPISLSVATTALLAEISNNRIIKSSAPHRKPRPVKRAATDEIEAIEDAKNASIPKKVSGKGRETNARVVREDSISKEERAALKEAERERKALAKEAAARQRALEKEQKAKDKQIAADLAEANKARWDKKISTPEMIVDLPTSIDGTSIDTQIREMLKNLDVETSTDCSLLPNVIRWRRKARAAFNEDLGHWELRPLTILNEAHVLCLVGAQDFVSLVADEADKDTLDKHVSRIRTKYPDSKVIYLIEGLETWQRKRKTAQNREYQAAVRGTATTTSTNNARRKAHQQPSRASVDDATLEAALLELQVEHECLTYHTENPFESAQWVAKFTEHISTIPYRAQRSNVDSSFCMEVGQVKTGDDKQDTYLKMLQQIVRVTAPIAYGIAAEYPDVLSLMDGFRKKGSLALEDLKKHTNKDGSLSDARIGPQISRRIANVMLGEDPLSMNI